MWSPGPPEGQTEPGGLGQSGQVDAHEAEHQRIVSISQDRGVILLPWLKTQISPQWTLMDPNGPYLWYLGDLNQIVDSSSFLRMKRELEKIRGRNLGPK